MKYFIVKRAITSQTGDLIQGDRIFTSAFNHPPIGVGGDIEGPFESLKDLIDNSQFYLVLNKQNPKRAGKIVNPKYIKNLIDYILIPKGRTFEKDFFYAFVHSMLGELKNDSSLVGCHFFRKDYVKITNVIDYDFTGVIFADIERYDFATDSWHKKKNTTIFPLLWNESILLDQLYHADKTKIALENSKYKYRSTTPFGVSVEFIIMNGILKTMYPILNKELYK